MDYQKKIDDVVVEKILSKSVRDMPQNPAAQGYKEKQIKAFYWVPVSEILSLLKKVEQGIVESLKDLLDAEDLKSLEEKIKNCYLKSLEEKIKNCYQVDLSDTPFTTETEIALLGLTNFGNDNKSVLLDDEKFPDNLFKGRVPVRTENGNIIVPVEPDNPDNAASVLYVNKIEVALRELISAAEKAIAFENYENLIKELNSSTEYKYKIGQKFLFVKNGIVDLWVSGFEAPFEQYEYITDEDLINELNANGYIRVGYYKLSALEGKNINVDLAEYLKKKELLTLIEEKFLVGTAEPTTETVAPFVGALYVDTTNNATYQCTAIDTETPSYTWVQLIRSTDYPTSNNTRAGVIRIDSYYGMSIGQAGSAGVLVPQWATNNNINNKTNNRFISSHNIDYALIKALTTNENDLTDQEKAQAQEWLGIGSGGSGTGFTNAEYEQTLESSVSTYLDGVGGYFIIGELIATPTDGSTAWVIPINQVLRTDDSRVFPQYDIYNLEGTKIGYAFIEVNADSETANIRWYKTDNSYYEFENITGSIKYIKLS